MEQMPAGSKVNPPLAKAELVREGGIIYFRRGKELQK